jgi:hypothetical protein
MRASQYVLLRKLKGGGAVVPHEAAPFRLELRYVKTA